MTGTLLRIVDARGFGFLRDSKDGQELFFHISGCITPWDDLVEGQTVTFNLGQSRKGPCAVDVQVV